MPFRSVVSRGGLKVGYRRWRACSVDSYLLSYACSATSKPSDGKMFILEAPSLFAFPVQS